MNGKTHAMVGAAAAMVLLPFNNIPTNIAVSILGALLPDADMDGSKVNKIGFGKKINTAICIILLILLLYFYPVKSYFYLILLLILMILNLTSKHRGYSHSIIALTFWSSYIYTYCNSFLLPFIIGFVSHLILDILNKKPVHIVYLISKKEKGIALRLCYSDSKMPNLILQTISTLIIIGCLFIRLKT